MTKATQSTQIGFGRGFSQISVGGVAINSHPRSKARSVGPRSTSGDGDGTGMCAVHIDSDVPARADYAAETDQPTEHGAARPAATRPQRRRAAHAIDQLVKASRSSCDFVDDREHWTIIVHLLSPRLFGAQASRSAEAAHVPLRFPRVLLLPRCSGH